jgi:hypothetical protein
VILVDARWPLSRSGATLLNHPETTAVQPKPPSGLEPLTPSLRVKVTAIARTHGHPPEPNDIPAPAVVETAGAWGPVSGGSDSRGRSGDVADHHALPRNGTARGCHRLPAAPRDAQRVTQAEPPQRGQGFDSPGGHSGFQIPTCARCGHVSGDHGRASAGLHISWGRCFREDCDCPRYVPEDKAA